MSECTGGFGGLIRVSFTSGTTKNTVLDTGSKSDEGIGITASIVAFLLAIPVTIDLTYFLLDLFSVEEQDFFNDILNNGTATLGGYEFVDNESQIDNINIDYDSKKIIDDSDFYEVIVRDRGNPININILKASVIIETTLTDKQRFVTE